MSLCGFWVVCGFYVSLCGFWVFLGFCVIVCFWGGLWVVCGVLWFLGVIVCVGFFFPLYYRLEPEGKKCYYHNPTQKNFAENCTMIHGLSTLSRK